ncbi:hypothetical protein [Coralliovum pocilloporae]|uniref:hypothetical protein n=1 Tax=Coralliovum pocilloporae TaxID=3066369 RepID=UPI00330768C1
MAEDDFVELSDQQKRSRRSRAVALGIVLALFVVLLYAVTIVKFGPEVLNKSF